MRKNLTAALLAGLLAVSAAACQAEDAAQEEPAGDTGTENGLEEDPALQEDETG